MTEDDTFNRLRRVPYEEAVIEYSMVCMYLRSSAPTMERDALANPILKPLGWTVEELFKESRKKEHDI